MDERKTYEQGQAAPNNTKSLTVNLWAALGILSSAILVSIVTTAFTVGRTLNSDHFIVQSSASAITEIKSTYVRSDVYTVNQSATQNTLAEMNNRLNNILDKLDNLKK